MRTGVAEEIGARSTLEDANVALDDAPELPESSQPRGFYAVRAPMQAPGSLGTATPPGGRPRR